jgi:hypothetical protein
MRNHVRHSGAVPTGPRKARPEGGEPGIPMFKSVVLNISGFRVRAEEARPGMTSKWLFESSNSQEMKRRERNAHSRHRPAAGDDI